MTPTPWPTPAEQYARGLLSRREYLIASGVDPTTIEDDDA